MTSRFTLLTDPTYERLRNGLNDRMRSASDALDASNFDDLFDPVMRGVLFGAFERAGASEGTVWLVDQSRENLEPVVNNGPGADRFVGSFRQPLDRGLISMVFATEQTFCENEVYSHASQDKSLDQRLGVVTCAMLAIPLYFAHQLQGVISCVQLKQANDPADPPGFSIESVRHVQLASVVIGKLIDHRLLSVTVGWEAE